MDGNTAPEPAPDSWAADPDNEVGHLVFSDGIQMQSGTSPLASEGINRTLYFFEGDQIKLNDQTVQSGNLAVVKAHQNMQDYQWVRKRTVSFVAGQTDQ